MAPGLPQEQPAENGDADIAALRREAASHNVNEETLLATDYLNHFNEIAMILELLADCPDCIDEAKEWQPKTYKDHFNDSGFSAKEFMIAAYTHAPARYRQPFDTTISTMNNLVLKGIESIEAILSKADPEQTQIVVQLVTSELQGLIERASAIIHGADPAMDQTAVDTILEGD